VRRILLLAALALGAAGCAPNTADIVSALAKDPNAVCVTITTLYGSASYNRNHGCDANATVVAGAPKPAP
jgi:hypothetical protein